MNSRFLRCLYWFLLIGALVAALVLLGAAALLIFAPQALLTALRYVLAVTCFAGGFWIIASLVRACR